MKQVAVALDGLDFSACAVKYATFIASLTKANLTGVFLDDVTYQSCRIYQLIDGEGGSENKLNELNAEDDRLRKKSVKEFERICGQTHVKYKVRHERNIALLELLTVSTYTDMVILDRNNNFGQGFKKLPGPFLRDALSNMECPAFVVPSSYRPINKLIFLYDGSPPSVLAVRMFGYLLSAFCRFPLEILTVKQSRNYPDLSGKYLMNEWIKKYFTHVAYKILEGEPESAIVQYAKMQKRTALFIFGARQRGTLSHWFRESMADVLIQKV